MTVKFNCVYKNVLGGWALISNYPSALLYSFCFLVCAGGALLCWLHSNVTKAEIQAQFELPAFLAITEVGDLPGEI